MTQRQHQVSSRTGLLLFGLRSQLNNSSRSRQPNRLVSNNSSRPTLQMPCS
jgi:hypothetical protein